MPAIGVLQQSSQVYRFDSRKVYPPPFRCDPSFRHNPIDPAPVHATAHVHVLERFRRQESTALDQKPNDAQAWSIASLIHKRRGPRVSSSSDT